MSDHDRRFFDTFLIVLGALVLFTILIYVLAGRIAARTQHVWEKEARAAGTDLLERIRPVGTVVLPSESAAGDTAPPGPAPAEPPAAATAAAAAAGPAAVSGEEIYRGACFACHDVGIAGAPKLGDQGDWGPRIAQGKDTLVQHAIAGFQGTKGIMPPKGGRADLSDEAIAAAVEFMMSKAQ